VIVRGGAGGHVQGGGRLPGHDEHRPFPRSLERAFPVGPAVRVVSPVCAATDEQCADLPLKLLDGRVRLQVRAQQDMSPPGPAMYPSSDIVAEYRTLLKQPADPQRPRLRGSTPSPYSSVHRQAVSDTATASAFSDARVVPRGSIVLRDGVGLPSEPAVFPRQKVRTTRGVRRHGGRRRGERSPGG
jgi:hypothetical protein